MNLLESKQFVNIQERIIADLEKNIKQEKIELNYLRGASLDDSFKAVDNILINKKINLSLIKQDALKNYNLAIKIAETNKKLNDIDKHIILSAIYPTLSITASYFNNNTNADDGFIKSSINEGSQMQGSLNWQLFNSGQNINKIRNIKHAKKIIESKKLTLFKLLKKKLIQPFRLLKYNRNTIFTKESSNIKKNHFLESEKTI